MLCPKIAEIRKLNVFKKCNPPHTHTRKKKHSVQCTETWSKVKFHMSGMWKTRKSVAIIKIKKDFLLKESCPMGRTSGPSPVDCRKSLFFNYKVKIIIFYLKVFIGKILLLFILFLYCIWFL